jgi:probable F420-dependent oxidoreductase
MRFGLFGINFGVCADPDVQRRAALAAEESGFESVWTGEHVALPIQGNPVPTPAETPFLDSVGALMRVAALTSRIRLGTGILVLPHHNPVLLAKALATLDVLSGGRLITGFGGGYAEAEFGAIGVDFHRRGAITDDSLRAIRALWTQAEPAYDGRFARFAGIRFEPKPVQRPHPPIVVGGHAPAALARAAREGDGWYGFARTVAQTAPVVVELARLRRELGRGDASFEISLTTFEPLTRDLVRAAEDAGIHRLIVWPVVAAEKLEATIRDLGAHVVHA